MSGSPCGLRPGLYRGVYKAAADFTMESKTRTEQAAERKRKLHTKQQISENVSTCMSGQQPPDSTHVWDVVIHYRPVQRTNQVTKLHNIIEPQKR